MVLSRAAALPKGLGRTVLRRAGSTTRNRSWKQIGRRGYASEHGHQQSSEIPWIVGSLAVTIPAAGWLLQQGPKKSDHGHDDHHAEKHEEKGAEEEKEEEEQPQEEDSKEDESEDKSEDDSKDESKDDSKAKPKEQSKGDSKDKDEEKSKDEGKDEDEEEGGEKDDKEEEGGDDAKGTKTDGSDKKEGGDSKSDRQMSEDGYELPGPNAPKQINWHSGSSKGPGEGQKGERKPTEKKGEKDSQGDYSGAKHPYIDDPEKSKKGVGVTETARIHGTVDSKTGARGAGQTGSSSN